jgi:hypothetical protein
MKTKVLVYVLATVSVLFFQMQPMQAEDDLFYYYGDEKIFIKERSDKIFLWFDSTETNREKIEDLKNEVESFGLIIDVPAPPDVDYWLCALIETINGDNVPPTLYESCKANVMVLSATYVLEYENEVLQGLTGEFTVKLKSPSFYGQLEELALQNNCVIVKDNWPLEDHYMLSISKTSEFNSLQTANLFYETGLFEYASPDFVVLNAFNGLPNISGLSVELFQNYPNPFREETTIRYTLPAGVDRAEIQLFDLNGQRLKRYIADQLGQVVVKSSELKAGIYFYSLVIAGKTVNTKQMILTK